MKDKWEFFELIDAWVKRDCVKSYLDADAEFYDKLMAVPDEKSVPWMFEHLLSRPSWQVINMLFTKTKATFPHTHLGKLHHLMVDLIDWWEVHEKDYPKE
jgi:hypothetical protein